MKKNTKILLFTILVFIVILGSLMFWQRDNISAIINGMRYSSEDLASQLDTKREDTKKKVEKYIKIPINDLSSEDEEKLFKGEITIEEVSEKYKLPLDVMEENKGTTQDTEKNNNPKTDNNIISNKDSDNSKEIDKAISEGVSKMYALKAKYVSKLGELERTVYSEYLKLPKEEQNASSKKDIVTKNIKIIADMEQKCDKEVDEALALLAKQLKELKGDKEIVKVLKDAYLNEKEIKKAYYLSMYNKKD